MVAFSNDNARRQPRYLRKAKSVEKLLPRLCLKGVSTGDWVVSTHVV